MLWLASLVMPASAQEAVAAAGHDAMGPGGSAAFTVGQVAWEHHAGWAGSSAQGVQQAVVVPVTGISGPEGPAGVSVHPNPAGGSVEVRLGGESAIGWTYRLFDGSGRLWRFGQREGNTGEIDLDGLPPAAYFLHVTRSGKGTGTAIILKANRP